MPDKRKYNTTLKKNMLSALFLNLSLLTTPVLFCQSAYILPGNKNIPFSKDQKQTFSNNPLCYMEYLQSPDDPSTHPTQTKSSPESGFLLDSILEVVSDGYYDESRHWYYSYDASSSLDSISVYYFNQLGFFKHIYEKYSFNKSGQLTKYMLRQPDPLRFYLQDSTMIDYLVEEYEYRGDFLVKKTSTTTEYVSYSYVIEDNYFYDENGKLVTDSVNYNEQYDHCFRYLYNSEDKLEYYLFIYMNGYSIKKFTYTGIDTSRSITVQWVQYYPLPEFPVLDTISVWGYEKYFYETYDEQNRRTSLISYFENEKIYKATFTWTDFDSLLHTSYYNWVESGESGTWQEAMRIDNTYDEYGNLLIYEKTFYDARTNFWEIEDQKNYYYSSAPNGLPSNTTSSEKLIVFPNPAENEINVALPPSSGDFNFTIYTLYGVPLLNGKLENQAITVSQLKPGMYIIEVSNGRGRSSGKFIKR